MFLLQPVLLSDLVSYTPTYNEVAKVVLKIESHNQSSACEPLSIREEKVFIEEYEALTQALKEDSQKEKKTDKDEEEKQLRNFPPYADPFHKKHTVPTSVDHHDRHCRYSSECIHSNPLQYLKKSRRRFDTAYISSSSLSSEMKLIDEVLDDQPSCKLAVHAMKLISVAVVKLNGEPQRLDYCVSEVIPLIVKLMKTEPTSLLLQKIGLECISELASPATVHLPLPSPVLSSQSKPLSAGACEIILNCLTAENSFVDTLVEAIGCVVNNYSQQMSLDDRRSLHSNPCQWNLC